MSDVITRFTYALTLNKFCCNLWLRRNTPGLPLQVSQAKQSARSKMWTKVAVRTSVYFQEHPSTFILIKLSYFREDFVAHRASPKESVNTLVPIIRLRRVDSTRPSARWFSVIAWAKPPCVEQRRTRVSLSSGRSKSLDYKIIQSRHTQHVRQSRQSSVRRRRGLRGYPRSGG
jgi:hypothetical protein